MKYVKLVIAVDDEYQEALIAELLELEFDAFEQQDDKLITYVTRERFSAVNRERIEELLSVFPGNGYIQSEEVVADQNWNEEWEQTIKAQQIGRFFVKPTWSREGVPDGLIGIEINPKMAFGTGYHETTRLMLELLPETVEEHDSVLDAGTGTGILAIAAAKLGAGYILAFDIDDWSIQNATENIYINEVASKVEIKKGSKEVVPDEKKFDVILANINRNTILDLLSHLIGHLASGGMLLLSGLLYSDRDTILNQKDLAGFEQIRSQKENDWIVLLLKKKGSV